MRYTNTDAVYKCGGQNGQMLINNFWLSLLNVGILKLSSRIQIDRFDVMCKRSIITNWNGLFTIQ